MNNNTLILIILALSGALVLKQSGLLDRLRGIRNIDAIQARELVSGNGAMILDVRTAEEYAAAHIPGSRHIPLSQVKKRMAELDRYRQLPIVVSCRSGSRSARACSMLKRGGFEQVYNLKGGLRAWAATERSRVR